MLDYLITGGKGFIGQNLTNQLDKSNKIYKVVDIEPCGDPTTIAIDVAWKVPNIEADTLVHLASATNVRQSLKDPKGTIEQNVDGLVNCLELLREGFFNKLVFTSSASAESSMNPYLASKQSCENICKAYKESYGLNIRILKLSNVYGPYCWHKQSVIPRMIKECLTYNGLTVYGSGDQKRDFIYVDDVVNAILDESIEGHISTGQLTSIKQLIKIIQIACKNFLNYAPIVHYELPIKGEVINPITKSDIGTFYDLVDGIDLTFNWMRRYYAKQLERTRSIAS